MTNTTATAATVRLVNCTIAYAYKGELVFESGSDGIPARALKTAAAIAGRRTDVVGVRIVDVNTGEAWLVPVSAACHGHGLPGSHTCSPLCTSSACCV